jgi:aryl-alcohol dehydrogenase-like predicted oxidoreductase
MQRRALGTQGLVSSAIGLGCMSMSGVYGPRDDAESLATLHEAIDQDVTLIDTADFYGAGHNELLVRDAIRGQRDRVVLSVKFGALRDWRGRYAGLDGRPPAVKNYLAYSLVRLGVDHIDLYFPSRIDPQVPIEDTIGAVGELIHEGKVRFAGLSEASAATVRRANAVCPLSAVQVEYSLFTRAIEKELLPTLAELGIGCVAYGVHSRGLLSGAVHTIDDVARDARAQFPRFAGENLEKNLALVDRLRAFAQRKACNLAQLCVAWVLAREGQIVPLVGTKRRKYLAENLGAAEVRLDASDLAELDAIVPPEAVAGDRYPAEGMAHVNR